MELTQELLDRLIHLLTTKARLFSDVPLEEIVGQVIVDTAGVLEGWIDLDRWERGSN